MFPVHDGVSRLLLTFVFLSVLALAIPGCGLFDSEDDSNEPQRVVDRHRGTPDSLITYFMQVSSYPDSSITEMSTCLAPGFRFHFTPEDAKAIGRDFYTRTEFIASMTSMFAGAVDIEFMGISQGVTDTVTCTPEDSLETACPVTTEQIGLDVLIPDAPEFLIYMVRGFADFAVAEDPDEPELYVIVDIVDETGMSTRLGRDGVSATEPSTWGHVLALYE